MTDESVFDVIPTGAKVCAGVAFLLVAAMLSMLMTQGSGNPVFVALAIAAGAFMAAYVLFCGYVYGDAGRRGMPAGVWLALAIFVPNCVGFVLYFLLRKPLAHPCPNCGNAVHLDSAFCPRCGQPQGAATTRGTPAPDPR